MTSDGSLERRTFIEVMELDVGEAQRIIACSYCNTPLELSARGTDSVRFSVQVAEQPVAQW